MFPTQLFPVQVFSPHIFSRYFLSSINRTISDTLIFTDSVTSLHRINKSVSQNIVFSENITSFYGHSYNISDVLFFTQSVDLDNVFQRNVTQNIVLDQSLSSFVVHIQIINQSLSFAQNIKDPFVGFDIFTRNINQALSFVDFLSEQNKHLRNLSNTIIFTDILDYDLNKLEHLSDTIDFTQNLKVNFKLNRLISQNIDLKQHVSVRFQSSGIFIEDIPPTDTAGLHSMRSAPKNCFEVSDQCHAEGLETIAGLSYPCSIINGQTVLISDYDGGDFVPGSWVGFYNLTGGRTVSELIVQVNTISIVNDKDTLITFFGIVTDHTAGYISLLDTIAAHSEGHKTVASGFASHAGGDGAIAELPTKFARSDGGGDSQYSIVSLSATTIDSTLTLLTINGEPFRIRVGRTYTLFIHIAARNVDQSANENAYFIRQGIVHNENGLLTFVGSINTVGSDINNPDWAISITATDIFKISVVGQNGKTIKWIAKCECLEL